MYYQQILSTEINHSIIEIENPSINQIYGWKYFLR